MHVNPSYSCWIFLTIFMVDVKQKFQVLEPLPFSAESFRDESLNCAHLTMKLSALFSRRPPKMERNMCKKILVGLKG